MTTDFTAITGGILVAAGSSTRFGVDKQLAPLGGIPVLMHSVRRFLPRVREMVIAVPRGREDEFRGMIHQYGCSLDSITVIAGGDTRTASVTAAMAQLSEQCRLAFIHDAARPLVSLALLDQLLEAAQTFGGSVPGIPVVDTMLHTSEDGIMDGAIPREHAWRVATPQAFQLDKLRLAYQHAASQAFTDDAQVFFHDGYSVKIIPADQEELMMKITYPQDLARAEQVLQRQQGGAQL